MDTPPYYLFRHALWVINIFSLWAIIQINYVQRRSRGEYLDYTYTVSFVVHCIIRNTIKLLLLFIN